MTAVKYIGGIFRGTAAERAAYTTTNLNAGWIWIETDTNPPLIYFWTGSAWRLFTTKDVTETLTNKTLDFTNAISSATSLPTVTVAKGGTGQTTAQAAIDGLSQLTTTGDIEYYDGTHTTRLPKAAVGYQVLRTKYDLSSVEWARPGNFPSTGGTLNATNGRVWGYWVVAGGVQRLGLLGSLTITGTAPGFATFAAADGQKGAKYTPAASSGAQQGEGTATSISCRQWNPRFKAKFRLDNKADTRWFIGWNNTGGMKTGDDPLNAVNGIMFGKIADATNTNFVMMHNDGVGATVIDNISAADNLIHQIEIRADDANSKWWYSFDNAAEVGVTSDIPAQTTGLGWIVEAETTNTTQPPWNLFWIEMESG